MNHWYLLIVVALPFLPVKCQEDTSLLRTIPQGQLNGTVMTSRLGRQFYAYFKIPYAKPPLGPLRFSKPEKADGWTGIRDASVAHRVVCPTRNVYVKGMFFFQGDEDCLYLNVYTPLKPSSKRKLAVMVYIHGGGWISGSGNPLYYPPGYLLDKDIVLVVFNYRLGALGFLSMEDDKLPGNWGLKDQTFALKWVKENIAHFGGNPESVTIFGESAGGSSVHYHVLSPLSRGLFHRGISQSGTAFTPWSLSEPGGTKNNSIKLASALGCPTIDSRALSDCLRNKSIRDIVEKDVIFMKWITDPMIPFKPVVESQAPKGEAFLPERPEDILRAGKMSYVPWITGFTSGDGALRVSSIFDNDTLVRQLDEEFEDLVPMSLFLKGSTEEKKEAARKIRQFYLGNESIGSQNYMNVTNLWTDGWFGVGAREAVRLHEAFSPEPLYYYYFSYRGSVSFSSAFGDAERDYGVAHADELIYLFPMDKDFANHTYSESDTRMMDVMTEMWTNFAQFGFPHTKKINWDPVRTDSLEYLHFAQDGVRMESNLLPERFSFWDSLSGQRRFSDELSSYGRSTAFNIRAPEFAVLAMAIIFLIFSYSL